MRIPLNVWIPIYLGEKDPIKRFNAIKELHEQYGSGDLRSASIASCVEKVFLLHHCADSLTQLERDRLAWAEQEGVDLSPEAADAWVREYGLNGHLPHWLRSAAGRESIYLDMWTMRELAVQDGRPTPSFPEQAEDWVFYFSAQIAAIKDGRPQDVVPTYQQWLDNGRGYRVSSPRTPEPPHPAEDEVPI